MLQYKCATQEKPYSFTAAGAKIYINENLRVLRCDKIHAKLQAAEKQWIKIVLNKEVYGFGTHAVQF